MSLIYIYTYIQIANLLSDIGGQMGIWLGISVLTIVEFLQLIGFITKELFTGKSKEGYDNMDGENDPGKPPLE